MEYPKDILESDGGFIHVAAASTLIVILFGVVGLLQIHTSGSFKQAQLMFASTSAYAYAQACLHEGLLRFRDGTGYTGTTLTFDEGECTVTITAAGPIY